MKILYISYAKQDGGWWIHTSEFLAAIRSLHKDVLSYTPLAVSPSAGGKTAKKSEYVTGPFRELRYLAVVFLRRALGELRELRKHRPDAVILRWGRYLSALLLCRMMKIPILVELNGPILEEQFAPKAERFRWLPFWQRFEKAVLKLPSHIMVVSEPLREYYVNCGIDAEKISVLPNGVDTARFHPANDGQKIREKLGLQGKTVVGFSGHFAPWHGLDFLISAMHEVMDSGKDLVLLLIGQRNARVELPQMPANTVVTGLVPHEEMPDYLGAADIFVAPYPKIDPFYFSPLKIFEAMAAGKAVLASAQGQICELIVPEHSGLLYPAGDKTAFLRQLHRAVDDPAFRKELGKNARTRMEENYTWEHNAQKVLHQCQKFFRK
ncbi:MAG: glycosyltransferase family 4 protein [Desulfobacterales bacterium]